MSSFEDLQNEFQNNSSQVQEIEILADSVEDAIQEASEKLNAPRNQLNYEILEEGTKGVLGIGKKQFRIFFRKISSNEGKISNKNNNQKVDGKLFFKTTSKGIQIKITPPENNGIRINLEDVKTKLLEKRVLHYDIELVKSIVNEASGEWVKIGEWKPNDEYDSHIQCEISPDSMKAYVMLTEPIFTGRTYEKEELIDILNQNEIISGIKEDVLENIIEEEIYNSQVLVAEGKYPVDGTDAKMDYKFKINPREKLDLKEDEQGRISYFDLDLVQNVVEGQILATKIPPTKGVHGYNVSGNQLLAEDGQDFDLPVGRNTYASPSELDIIAEIQGQAILENGYVCVDPVFTVPGNVGVETGNIVFLGTVLVKGSVDDGFSVKASKSIEIRGGVGKSELEAEENIIVKGGINGKDEGKVKAGKFIYAKFINAANVEAGETIYVLDGILHSYVSAGENVLCIGRKGKIVGGKIIACKEINAIEFGSYGANTETRLESGTDPKAKLRLRELEDELEKKESLLHKIKMNLDTLKKAKITLGKLPEKKEIVLQKLIRANQEYTSQVNEIAKEISKLHTYLEEITTSGKISAKNNVYPGVDLIIKNVSFKIHSDFSFVTFVMDAGMIRPIPYQETKINKELEEIIESVNTPSKDKKKRSSN